MASNFIEIVGVSDAGSVRQFNEDSIAYDVEGGFMVLADGMGGHRAGEVASRMATEIIFNGLQADVAEFRSSGTQHSPQLAVIQSINRANEAVFAAAEANPAQHGMGTTLALAVFCDNRVILAHVGDSRIYRLRNGHLQLLTRDDSLLRQQIELGVIAATEARESHNRNLVTRALGIEKQIAAHVRDEAVLPGDVFLLCSDGLNDLVEEADIELIMHALNRNLPLAAQHLVQTAKDNGGFDNVSVILAKVREPFSAASRRSWIDRMLAWFR